MSQNRFGFGFRVSFLRGFPGWGRCQPTHKAGGHRPPTWLTVLAVTPRRKVPHTHTHLALQ